MCMMMRHITKSTSKVDLDSQQLNTLEEHQLLAQTRSKSIKQSRTDERQKDEILETEDRNTHGNKATQITVQGYLGNVKVIASLDTGASVSFASEEVMRKMKPSPKIIKQSLEIVLGDASVKESKGKICSPLTLNGVQLSGEFNILTLPTQHFNVILGNDFLIRHSCQLCLRTGNVSFTCQYKGHAGETRQQINGLSTITDAQSEKRNKQSAETKSPAPRGVRNDDL
eukprot:SAG11_NODE_5058_length_1677_cov_1.302915_2_plen_227_part_00